MIDNKPQTSRAPFRDNPISAPGKSGGSKLPPAKAWFLSVALLSPLLIPYGIHLLATSDGAHSTGFIQADMPIYMAKAREYFDQGFGWTYANPSATNQISPRIYFQPWTFALGIALKATGQDVGSIFLWFGLISVLACALVTVRLYEELVGLHAWPQRVGLLVFFWGGGLLVAAGAGVSIGRSERLSYENLFQFDPASGWWFLNFGRNLIYPTEAFYHFLFFGTILLTIRRRLVASAACTALTASCHPFTGLELAAILWVWLLIEVFFLGNREQLGRFLAGVTLVLTALLSYYLVFLNQFPEHRVIAAQMSMDWDGFQAINFIPADALVGALALWRLRNIRVARATLDCPRNRLFLIWAVVSFMLANHEFAVSPRQPIHFTRGYIWTSLFLLGLPALLQILHQLGKVRPRVLGRIGIALTVGLLLTDNLVWFLFFPVKYFRDGVVPGVRITDDQSEVLSFLSGPKWNRHLLISEDRTVGYLATAYTPLRSWRSHWIETPEFDRRDAEIKALTHEGAFRPEWLERPLLILIDELPDRDDEKSEPKWVARNGLKLIHRNPSYRLFERLPPRAAIGPRPDPGGRA